jgi:hypothetical protein
MSQNYKNLTLDERSVCISVLHMTLPDAASPMIFIRCYEVGARHGGEHRLRLLLQTFRGRVSHNPHPISLQLFLIHFRFRGGWGLPFLLAAIWE